VGDVSEALPAIYEELRRLAGHYLRQERPDHTLQPTALVHEAYLRLSTQDRVQWKDRNHFIGVAAQLMRRILVDHARAHHADKRGGHNTRIPLEDAAESLQAPGHHSADVLDLDRAMTELAALDARQAQIVELRYFGGLSVEEAGEALSVSPATIKREWRMARAWLHRALTAPVVHLP
jgi:RNA polymerase sigma-70 factor (ECF subfamily)